MLLLADRLKQRLMKLAAYLEANGLTHGAFARLIGACNARTIQRYTVHNRVPSGPMIARIVAATDGAVQPTDFIDDPAPS